MFDDLFRKLQKDYQPLPIANAEAERRSNIEDAAADLKWFRKHPHVMHRERPPSALEIAARALPPGATVCAIRLADGTQFRLFLTPKPATQSVAGV
jgi:hypothetical protein